MKDTVGIVLVNLPAPRPRRNRSAYNRTMVRTATTLSYDEAETFYDRMGRRQDTQGFYEDIALDELVAHGRLEEAHDILELGCGTGRLAERLLREVLPDDARYVGLDVSSTMLHIARERLSPFGERARVDKTEGSLALPCPDGSFDRVVATYVADLLSNDDIDLFLSESWRVLRPGGLFASAGLTRGERLPSRLVSSLWSAVHRLSPAWSAAAARSCSRSGSTPLDSASCTGVS